MNSPIYKPVARNGDTAKVPQSSSTATPEHSPLDMDTQCGCLGFRPNILQPFARIGCFTGFYSLAALITSTLTVYVNSQITTLERQFGFSSHQTGIIMAANDIGYLLCVLFVSYTASKVHVPRSLGVATMIYGISGLACSLPHFLYGARNSLDEHTSTVQNRSIRPSIAGDLCKTNHTVSSCAGDHVEMQEATRTAEYVATVSMTIIVIGMMLQGFGKAPRFTFTITYIDNNTAKVNTGFYIGIISTLGILGPAVAFFMGGMFSRIYVTLESTNLDPKHPKWIGAWWLGYFVFGSLALLVALPLYCFPRKMPKRSTGGEKDGHKNGTETSRRDSNNNTLQTPSSILPAEDDHTKPSLRSKFSLAFLLKHGKEFVSALLRLWTNPVYLLTVASSCFVLFAVGGSSAYSPKYMERIFHLPAYKANYILAGQVLFAACVGTFVGGYLSKRCKMTALKALKFTMVVVSISCASYLMGFVFKCVQPAVHNWPSSEENCVDDCHCEDNSFFPICGGDGKTYYSPCQAGCSIVENKMYHNCTCIEGGEATYGICDYGCDHLYAYIVFAAIRTLFGTMSIIPKMVIYIRSVADKDKSIAVGFSSFMTSLLGWLLSPIVFGNAIDGICTIWDINCDVRGRCLLYDNELFRIKFHGYACTALGLSLTCVVLAYVYARCTKCLDDPEKVPKATKKKVVEMMLVVDGEGAGSGHQAADVVASDDDNDASLSSNKKDDEIKNSV